MKIEKVPLPEQSLPEQKGKTNPQFRSGSVLKYYMRDAQEGIRRNLGAVTATILLMFISLTITGAMVLLQTGVDDVIRYLNDQVKLKVLVDVQVDTEQVADILREQSYVKSAVIETKEETLDKLQQFFRDMPHLFDSFRDSNLPDTIMIELHDQRQAEIVANELKKTKGITDVIYAQAFAERVVAWSNAASTYGFLVLAIFLLASILTVSIAMNLGLYQRQKDIRVKLLLGAKETHVRGQFMFEGFLIGFIGSLLAAIAVYIVYYYGLYQLQLAFRAVFDFTAVALNLTLLGIILFGILIGLIGTYLSTRKMIKHG